MKTFRFLILLAGLLLSGCSSKTLLGLLPDTDRMLLSAPKKPARAAAISVEQMLNRVAPTEAASAAPVPAADQCQSHSIASEGETISVTDLIELDRLLAEVPAKDWQQVTVVVNNARDIASLNQMRQAIQVARYLEKGFGKVRLSNAGGDAGPGITLWIDCDPPQDGQSS